ncbi:MAG: ABC transporter substrate-binding protein [Actinomycetota bacterium]
MHLGRLARCWLVVIVGVAAACSGTDSATTDASPSAAAPALDDEAEPNDTAAESDADTGSTPSQAIDGDDVATSDDGSDERDVTDDETTTYPLTIEHIYGETTIDEEPQRIITIGVGEQDYPLALGVTPVALREYYGGQPFTVWPWARDELGDAEPDVLSAFELNLERIAALQPDVIMALNSAIDVSEYDILSQIAPVVARPAGTTYQGVEWRTTLATHGLVLNRQAEADQVEADVDELFSTARAENPAFDGRSISVVSFNGPSEIGTYPPADVVYQVASELGLEPNNAAAEFAGDSIRAYRVSAEQLSLLDADVVVWLTGTLPATAVADVPTRASQLTASQARAEVAVDSILFSAIFNTTPLSAEFLVSRLVPEFAAALDDDSTTVPSSTAALYGLDANYVPTADERAAMDAWEIALGSDATIEEKAIHVGEFVVLEPIVDEALSAGAALGGVTITPIRASIFGDAAQVIFDATIGDGTPTTSLVGEVERIDGVWVAPREQLCLYIGFIGVTCPK